MPKRIHPKVLLVEGHEDKRVIPQLIEANGIPWGETADEAIVFIEQFEGISNLVKPGIIEAELKASGREAVGIMVDADENAEGRWAQIRSRCLPMFPGFPTDITPDGLIEANADGLRLGVWLMPDNKSHGMLETFLLFLAPDKTDPVVQYAKEACARARQLGATYKEVHTEKALIHTWLAWQDEPGQQLHEAVKTRVLNPTAPYGAPFVRWFRALFEI